MKKYASTALANDAVIRRINVQGRRPGGEWGTMNRLHGDNAEEVEKNAADMLVKWQNCAMDGQGPFLNWEFRLVEGTR